MPALNKLSAVTTRNAPPGKHSDGGGLWLHKRADGGAQWFLRYTLRGRRREMGLGSLNEVSLASARKERDRWREVLREGKDPISERNKLLREAARSDTSLRHVAVDAFEARKAELREDGKAGRWFSPLELHILPKLGGIPIEELTQHEIKATIAPLWHTKAETAKKALSRLNIVMRHAAALGLDVDLQVVEKARALLGQSRHETKHIPHVHWQKVPDFYASLADPTITHLALRLVILTGMRSKPVRNLHLSQIDGDLWTIPAHLMKGPKGKTRDFCVPLSCEALRVINLARPLSRNGFLFPNTRIGVISDATMIRLMERRGMKERPHGFRSSLRTWLAETTDAPHEVAEACIAHASDSKVVRTYRRTDFLEQRRPLMERWAEHVCGGYGKLLKLAGE